MGAHEELEHAEHAAHSGGHGAKHMGVTMAALGVLIAFATAMVGSQRQELMTTLLDQSWAHSSSVAAAIKSKIAVSDLQRVRDANSASAGAANPALSRLLQLDREYASEYKLAKKWDDSCEPLIDAHYDAAEGYEHAQVLAEIGIIIASLGILLASRLAWIVSLVAGALCVGQMTYNYVSTRRAVSEHHEQVHAAEHAYDAQVAQQVDDKDREALLEEVDPGGKLRAALPQPEATAGHADSSGHAASTGHGASPSGSANEGAGQPPSPHTE